MRAFPNAQGRVRTPKRLYTRGYKPAGSDWSTSVPRRPPLRSGQPARDRRIGNGGAEAAAAEVPPLYTLLRHYYEAPSAHEAERQDGYRGTLEEWPSARRSAAVRARPSAPRWECANEPSRTSSLYPRSGPARSLSPSRRRCSRAATRGHSYLVDPASSHMLVSKIKPCMSKYIPRHGETAKGSLNQLWFLRSYNPTWITVAILELIHATQLRPPGKSAFVSTRPTRVRPAAW